MKLCPICNNFACEHKINFIRFELTKVRIIRKSLEVATKLINFIPDSIIIQHKMSYLCDDLKKCCERIVDIEQWYETNIK